MKKLATLITLIFLAGCSAQSSDTIKLGFIGPLTGDASEFGLDEQYAIKIALEEINSAGGINGQQLEVIFEDGKCTGIAAANSAQKLVNVDKVEVILGGACSGETLAIAPIAEEAKVVLLTAFSSNPAIKNAGDYVFRNSVNDEEGGESIVKLVTKDHKRIAVLTEKTSYAEAFEQVVRREIPNYGGEIVAIESYEQEATDYRSQLTKIAAITPDAIIFNAQSGKSGGRSVRQAYELGVPGEYYGTFYASGNDFQQILGELVEGLKFIDAPSLKEDTPRRVEFINKFFEKAGRKPSNFLAGSRYDTVYMIKEAIESVGYSGEAVKDYLYQIDYDGIFARSSFDSYGEPEGIYYAHYVYENGEVVEI